MDVYLPRDVESLTNKHFQLTQKLLDIRTKSATKRTNRDSFLAKLNDYNSHDIQQQLSKRCEDFSSLYRLEVVFNRALELLGKRLAHISHSALNSTKVPYLILKVLISYFGSFYTKLDGILSEFKNDYTINYNDSKQQQFNIIEIFKLGKNYKLLK